MTSRESEAAGETERRTGTRALIDRLLAERQQMFVLYERVAGVEPYSEELPSDETVRQFAQILVDYIAAGHFGLYDRISEGNERRRSVIEKARAIYPRIVETTDTALEFSDALDRSGGAMNYALAKRLSELGEVLATRVELEDELIDVMAQTR